MISLDRPQLMGILNLSSDSFYDGGKYRGDESILARIRQIYEEGAVWIDVGGMSTRPGAVEISLAEEKDAILHALDLIRKSGLPLLISVDTYRREVAQAAFEQGAHLLNDISGGNFDPGLWDFVAEKQIPYVLSHIYGKPENWHNQPPHEDVVRDVMAELSEKIKKLNKLGITDIIIDPGFGFGKNLEENYLLLKQLPLLYEICKRPMLVGVSRKRMIQQAVGENAENCLPGTLAAGTLALCGGAHILRVHDVAAHRQVLQVFECWKQNAD